MTAIELEHSPRLDAAERRAILDIITARSFRRGRFTLASGRESDLYFNLKPTMMDPRGAHLCAKALLDVLGEEGADFVGGLEMGVVPLIGAVAAVGEIEGRPIKTFFVRKKPKEHGTRDLIEGLGPGETLAGQRVVIADDVATSGGSIQQAVEAVRAAGGLVESAVVLVDREEGATELLAGHGIRLNSVLRASEFA